MYSKMFPGGNPTAFSENVFRTFDTNNSGTIDFRWDETLQSPSSSFTTNFAADREFMLAINITSNGSPEEKLTWAFKVLSFYNFLLGNPS